MRKIFQTAFFLMLFVFTNSVWAIPLNNEYSINVATTQIDNDSWTFNYAITNNNQQIGDLWTGLDGFFVQVPISATITNITNPAPYWGGGQWANFGDYDKNNTWAPEAQLKDGYQWLGWWGEEASSTYPIGSTANFSFQADGVRVGSNSGVEVTYWAWGMPQWDYIETQWGRYTGYSQNIISPVMTPEPNMFMLMFIGMGILSISKWIKK